MSCMNQRSWPTSGGWGGGVRKGLGEGGRGRERGRTGGGGEGRGKRGRVGRGTSHPVHSPQILVVAKSTLTLFSGELTVHFYCFSFDNYGSLPSINITITHMQLLHTGPFGQCPPASDVV